MLTRHLYRHYGVKEDKSSRKSIPLLERTRTWKLTEVDTSHNSAMMFSAVRVLNRKPFENPFVNDEKGHRTASKRGVYDAIRGHFSDHFFNKSFSSTQRHVGEPKPLDSPITEDEILDTISHMRNRRAPGFDGINIELIKYGPPELIKIICSTLNAIFEEHEDVELGRGLLAPLLKPGKPKGPKKNLRPVILLPIIRKILSGIALCRLQSTTESYLSSSQSAYRRGRSTSDVVWSHRWVLAKVQKHELTVFCTGIDMTSAFDTIDRSHFIQIIDRIGSSDDSRLARVLVSDTSLEIKFNGIKDSVPFTTNIGSPQGDAISGTFFNIYFEDALRLVRQEIREFCGS